MNWITPAFGVSQIMLADLEMARTGEASDSPDRAPNAEPVLSAERPALMYLLGLRQWEHHVHTPREGTGELNNIHRTADNKKVYSH